MSSNNTDIDTSMSIAVHAAPNDDGSKAPAAAADESGTKRKRPKPSGTTIHPVQFHGTSAGPQTAEHPTASLTPAKPRTLLPWLLLRGPLQPLLSNPLLLPMINQVFASML